MHVSFEKKILSMGVGEFSAFRLGPASTGSGGRDPWRAQVGQTWHSRMRAKTEGEEEDARFEVTLESALPTGSWRLRLHGRADQVIRRGSKTLLREIKSVTFPLPAHENDLRTRYPEYFTQAAAYTRLLRGHGDYRESDISGELTFIEISTGITQPVVLNSEDDAAFERQLAQVTAFTESRHEHLRALRNFRHNPPFPSLREGQEGLQDELDVASDASPFVLFEAPTGYGKTGCILDFALRHLQQGRYTRVLYLTGKSTGQLQTTAQLRAMLPESSAVTALQVRNKREHCIHTTFHCHSDCCPYLDNLDERWRESGLGGQLLAGFPPPSLEESREAGRQTGVCPFEVTRSSLPHVDVWIGDFNYLFSPSVRGFFLNQPGFDPSSTLLILDEAHNLPSRAADNLSFYFDAWEVASLLAEISLQAVPATVRSALEAFHDFLSSLQPCDELDPPLEYEMCDLIAAAASELASVRFDFSLLSTDAFDLFNRFIQARSLLPIGDIDLNGGSDDAVAGNASPILFHESDHLFWCDRAGNLRCSCLDAADFIARTVKPFRNTFFLSATLGPPETFQRSCGIEHGTASVVTRTTPWRRHACRVAVDLRVDTRLKERGKYAPHTALTIARLREDSPMPVAVFFSSYRYARMILEELELQAPAIRVALQKKGGDLADQEAFIEESLVLSDVMFLVLGSSYAESVDLLGGRIRHAMVVGPALPEVNAIQNAKMRRSRETDREQSFHHIYRIPGMQKVNQAIGRLVRAPGHEARILLHCRRFSESDYHSLLHMDYQPFSFVSTEDELNAWLQEHRT